MVWHDCLYSGIRCFVNNHLFEQPCRHWDKVLVVLWTHVAVLFPAFVFAKNKCTGVMFHTVVYNAAADFMHWSLMKSAWCRLKALRYLELACMCSCPFVIMLTALALFLWNHWHSDRTAPPLYSIDEPSLHTTAAKLLTPKSMAHMLGMSVLSAVKFSLSRVRHRIYLP